MSYNLVDIPVDDLPEFLEDNSPQAIAGWIQDLPVFFYTPLVVRFHSKTRAMASKIKITKITQQQLQFDSFIDEWPATVDFSNIDARQGSIRISGRRVSRRRKRQIYALVELLALFIEHTDRHRWYPFWVIYKNSIAGQILKNRDGREKPTIVYLDRPPTGMTPEGSHSTLDFGYPRRAHRRTLRHPRYRNHPKYGVYKGVRVRQSWCGPKEYHDHEHIYRLMETL